MQGLIIFLSGIIIATIVEPIPQWAKTVIWVVLVVVGIVLGGLTSFKLG